MEQPQETSTTGNTMVRCAKRRNYFITFWINDYPKQLPNNAKYLITCEDYTKNNKWHGHAFIYYKNPITLKGVKKIFGKDCHIEIPHRNSECIDYIKDTTKRKFNILEYGTRPMDNGIHKMEDVIECKNISEVIEKMPDTYVRYRNGIKDIIEHKKKNDRYYKPIEVIWVYGPTGTGKTRIAFEAGATPIIYTNGYFSDWGDSRILALEELRGEVPYRELLKLTDSYHNYYSANIKGGQKLIDIDKLIITSPSKPELIYYNQVDREDSINQLLRRITQIINLNVNNNDDAD